MFQEKKTVCIIKNYPDIKNQELFIGFSEKYINDHTENSFREIYRDTRLDYTGFAYS